VRPSRKTAQPAVIEADEVAEGGVLGFAPDAAVFDDGPVLRGEEEGEKEDG
jgi:hypothetical protein